MRRPSEEAITAAVMWLHCNEGGGDEAKHCAEVADYLDHLMDEAALKRVARHVGVSVPTMRAKLADYCEVAHTAAVKREAQRLADRATERAVRADFEAIVKAERGE